MVLENIDLVIQGKYTEYVEELIDHYKQLRYIDSVIISDFEDGIVPKKREYLIHVTVPRPDDEGTGNRNLQIATSYAGLKKVKTRYAIKLRSDQKYSLSCITKMYAYFLKNKERSLTFSSDNSKPKNSIITGGVFSPFPFHPRDHIFFGHKEDLIDLFNIPFDVPHFRKVYNIWDDNESLHYDKYIRTEAYIGSHYCSNFNDKIKDFLEKPELYLHDGAERRNEAMEISNQITHQIFKPVPSKILELEWPKYGWTEYKVQSQRDIFGERWKEDFN